MRSLTTGYIRDQPIIRTRDKIAIKSPECLPKRGTNLTILTFALRRWSPARSRDPRLTYDWIDDSFGSSSSLQLSPKRLLTSPYLLRSIRFSGHQEKRTIRYALGRLSTFDLSGHPKPASRVTRKAANENEAWDVDPDVGIVAFVGMSNVFSEGSDNKLLRWDGWVGRCRASSKRPRYVFEKPPLAI